MAATDIILGDGVFSIDGTAVALTRGGGKFMVEREYRAIEADGDYGPVKDRQRLVKSVAKLNLKSLEILSTAIPTMYPGMDVTTGTLTGTAAVVTGDYQDTVTWVGADKGGNAVTISISNALNLENLDWGLVDKEEIIAELTFTAHYTEAARTTEPWSVVFA